MRWPGFLAGVAVVVAAACGSDETLVSPLPVGSVPDGSVSDAPTEEDALPAVRSVVQRNPFGNVEAADNLLWDGDFEWHSAFASQYGWAPVSLFTPIGSFDQVVIGAECRSGMKCGFLTPGQRVAAIGVSPGAGMVSASVWVKSPSGSCADIVAQVIACDYAGDPELPLAAVAGPDADGWCQLAAVGPERKRPSCLSLVARHATGRAFVDDAVVRAVGEGAMAYASPRQATREERVWAEQARAVLREWLKPGRVQPPEARRRYQAWRAR
jgi:hypothetical protein